MTQAKLPISFWGDALLSATYIINSVSSKFVPSTPYELWKGETSYLSIMRPWGCAACIHNTSHEYKKLGPMGKKCIFKIYSNFSKGYAFLGEDMTGRVTEIHSCDVIFLEYDFPKKWEIYGDFQLYEMEDPEASGSAREVDSTPSYQDGMGYHAPLEVSESERLVVFYSIK